MTANRKKYVVLNLAGSLLCMVMLGAMVSDVIVGWYIREHRVVENNYHQEIIDMIGKKLLDGDAKSAVKIISIYQSEVKDTNFMRSSLADVIKKSKDAQQVDTGKADPISVQP
jgi:hypothetical protein